jgi:Fe2+ transport system protein FeoA
MSPETFRKLVMFFEFVHASSLDINEHFTDFCNSLQQVQLDRNHQAGPRNNGQKPGRHRFRWGRIKKLSQLKPGERGIVTRIRANQMIRQRLIDMGVLPRVEIFLERIAPLGDPIEIKLRGYHLSIRKDEAEAIWVQPAD